MGPNPTLPVQYRVAGKVTEERGRAEPLAPALLALLAVDVVMCVAADVE